MIKIF